MEKRKVFRRLKNGKVIETHYKISDDIIYTIRLGYKDDLFILHTFNFDGNDVLDESNYKDESITTYSDFTEFIQAIELRFPGTEIEIT